MRIIDRMRWMMQRDINYGYDCVSELIRVYDSSCYPTVDGVDVKIWKEQIEVVAIEFATSSDSLGYSSAPSPIVPRPFDSGSVFYGGFDSFYTETMFIFIAYENMSGGISLYPIRDSEYDAENMKEIFESLTKERYHSVFELDDSLQRIINL